MRLVDPAGLEWTVKRRWMPRYEGRGFRERYKEHAPLRKKRKERKERKGGEGPEWFDFLDVFDLGDIPGVAAVFTVIIVVVLLFLFGIPLLLAVFDAVFVAAVAVGGVIARLLFRRPWTVEARSRSGQLVEERVVGWRRSGRVAKEVAQDLSLGLPTRAGVQDHGAYQRSPKATLDGATVTPGVSKGERG